MTKATPQDSFDRTTLPPLRTIRDRHAESTLDARDAVLGTIEPTTAPAGAPNVVVVLIDDMGFGASSAFGGPCRMPAAERLSSEGLRYNRFHTTALCSPTRQALLTGRNHHAVNMGTITELATAIDGYSSVRPDSAATLAQVLRLNGYNTSAFGKMHQTPAWETGPSGPFDRWPTGEGFEKFYGFVGAETDQWSPVLFDGTSPVPRSDEPNYHCSADLVDQAIDWVSAQTAITPDKPFFTYLSFGATHSPHHAPPEYIERYRGAFDHGWDRQREITLAQQKQAGLAPDDCELTARPAEIPAWDDLTPDEQRVAARLMEVYAGFAEHTDDQVGRFVDHLTELGRLDNTLFIYILGDNGASGEGGLGGCFNEVAILNGVVEPTDHVVANLDKVGGPLAYNHYPVGWAHAMNTPFQWTKQVASHWGGTRVGSIIRWPEGITAKAEVRRQWHHVIDIYPTILEAARIPIPQVVQGVDQQRLDGISMAYSFDNADAAERRTVQYFEMFGNRGIYHHGWTAATRHSIPWDVMAKMPAFAEDVWELYAPDDWSQARDLAADMPAKLAELQQLFLAEGARNNVLPLDDRRVERFNDDVTGRPNPLAGKTCMTLRPGSTHLSEHAILNIKNKSFTITADLDIDGTTPADGQLIAQGGRSGGWAIYFRQGVLTYCHNYLGLDHYRVVANTPIAPGRHHVRFEFDYDGGGVGRGGDGTLLIDDTIVGTGRIDRTLPFTYSFIPQTAVGVVIGTPVADEIDTSGGFRGGTIDAVTVATTTPATGDPSAADERKGAAKAALAVH